jgi:hypothetical protein
VTFPHLLSGDFLFSSPIDPPSAGFAALTAGYVLLFLLSAFVYWRRAKLAPTNPPLRRLIRRVSKAGMNTAGIGIFLAIMRYLEVPYLDAPILLYLLILTMIGLVGYYVYDLSERYPQAVYQLQESALHRRYRPVAADRPAAARPRVARPGKEKGKGKRR